MTPFLTNEMFIAKFYLSVFPAGNAFLRPVGVGAPAGYFAFNSNQKHNKKEAL